MTRTNCPSEFPHTIRRHKVDEDGNEVYEDILNEEEEVVGKKPVYEHDQYSNPHQFPGGLVGSTTPFVRAIWFGFIPAKDFAVNALDRKSVV